MAKNQPMYGSWYNMKSRCNNPNYKNFHLWGGRGITYDKSWEKFDNFAKDMASTYKNGLSLDRIDNDGNYCKENCKWSTSKEQNNNRSDNRMIQYRGIKKTLAQWVEYLGLRSSTVRQRFYVYKWDIEKCFNGN